MCTFMWAPVLTPPLAFLSASLIKITCFKNGRFNRVLKKVLNLPLSMELGELTNMYEEGLGLAHMGLVLKVLLELYVTFTENQPLLI